MTDEPPLPPTLSAVVVAGPEETRVLLRGLLRLHHYRIVGEADGTTQGSALIGQSSPSVLVLDANVNEGSSVELVQECKRRWPGVRVVLVQHGTPPQIPEGGGSPDIVLKRPFRIQEFAAALAGSPHGPPPAIGR
jgi:DNA-binding NarL/FixJ family response regulator